MKPKRLLCVALVLSSGLLGCSEFVQNPKIPDIKISFAKPFVAPFPSTLPKELLFPSGWDTKEHGAFANIVAQRISALDVTWANSKYFETESQIQLFLRELLSSPSQTWTYHAWSFVDDQPILVATVDHVAGKPGKLFVWSYPNIYWAYSDENGEWWWSMNSNLTIPKLEKP